VAEVMSKEDLVDYIINKSNKIHKTLSGTGYVYVPYIPLVVTLGLDELCLEKNEILRKIDLMLKGEKE
jgi:hypothetical protein